MNAPITLRGSVRRSAVGYMRAALLCLATVGVPLITATAATPIITDSRIKTFVYNPNEVYSVTTHYGYQSNIEFAEKETIDTVSVGDRVGWQIIPSGRRLFIRAMEENAHTNMTIVTNRRAYQFDLRSSSADAVFGSEELTYVVRFFYPDEATNVANPNALSDFVPQQRPVSASAAPAMLAPPMAAPVNTINSMGSAPVMQPQYAPQYTMGNVAPSVTTAAPRAAVPAQTSAIRAPINYRYTYSGAPDAAPVKIYDDGATTYFRFPTYATPRVAVITARGEKLDVPVRLLPDNVVAVDVVAQTFSVEQNAGQVTVYNEAGGA